MPTTKQQIPKTIPDIQNRFFGTSEEKTTGKVFIKEMPDSMGDETYYRRMMLYAQNSSTAKASIETLQSFIVADGFQDRKLAETSANMFQNYDQILSEIGYSWACFEGFALNVFTDVFSGNITKIETLPFYKVIRTNRNTFILNPRLKGDYGYKKNEDVEYLAFSDKYSARERAAEAERQMKHYKKITGYVLYAYIEKPLEEYYPIPGWFALEYDLRLEPEYSRREFGQVRNGFKGDKIIAHPQMNTANEIDRNTGQEIHGTSEYANFTKQVSEATKPGGDGGVILTEIKTSQEGKEIPLKVIDLNPFVGGADLAARRESIAHIICRGFKVPPVFIGLMNASGIGDTKQIADEINLFNDKINKIQRYIASVIKKLTGLTNVEITTHNPINYIPTEVMAKMTDDEIRALAGLEPLKKQIPSDKQKIIDNLKSLPENIQSAILSKISTEELLSWVGLTVPQTTQPNGNTNQAGSN